MAMKPYTTLSYAPSLYYQAPDYNVSQNYKVSERSLGQIVTGKGDFVSPTPHRYTKYVTRGLIGSIRYFAGGITQSLRSGSMPYVYNLPYNVPVDYDESARSAALSDAYEKLRGSVDVSVDLVQWRQTTQMISLYRRLVSGIAKSALRVVPWVEKIDQLKRDISDAERLGRRSRRLTRELNNSLNTLAQMRLEYVFGWRPTMGTIYDLAIMALNPKAPGLLVCEGKGRAFTKFVTDTYNIDVKVPLRHKVVVSDRCRVVLYFTPQATVLNTLGKISSLNPVSILYEATPFSFVLDWAVDVGGWIRTLETAFLHRNDFAGGYQTRTQRVTVSSSMSGINFQSPGVFTEYALNGDQIRVKFDRTTGITAPYPVRPAKQFSFGVEKQLNALALAKVTLLRADNLLANRR